MHQTKTAVIPAATGRHLSAGTTAPLFTWCIFALYLILLAVSVTHHELWGDELHSWNIAKGSSSFTDLIRNSRYEGHPPVWYVLMWLLSKCTHNLAYLQCLQYCIISAAVYLFLVYAPFPKIAKALLPFGYFFLFEYGTLSRNYAIGVLFAFCICILFQRREKISYVLYYLLLFLLSNTHLIGLLLAASMHLYFLLRYTTPHRKKLTAAHLLAGGLCLLPAVYFIFPPSDSQLDMHFWIGLRSSHIYTDMVMAPEKAFLTIPNWHNYHFWNTNFLDGTGKTIRILSSLMVMFFAIISLKDDRKSLWLFITNFLLTCAVEALFSMNSTRYVGFLFIGFVVAVWLHCARKPLNRTGTYMLYTLLVIQICGSVVAVSRNIKYPFSNAGKVPDILKQVPAGEQAVSDYWCLNNVAAYIDTPFYCIEFNKPMSFLLWNKELFGVMATHAAYTKGFNKLFRDNTRSQVWMISTNAPAALKQKDSNFIKTYHVQLASRTTGAVENGGDLYLYHISK